MAYPPIPGVTPDNNATVPDIAPWAQATNTDDVPKLLTPRPPQILEHNLATSLTTNVFAAQRADWRSRTTIFTGTGTGARIFNIGLGAFQDGDWQELRRNSTGAVSIMLLAGQTFSDGTTVRALRENETIRIIRSGTIWYYTTDSGGAVSADRLPPLRQRFAFYQNSDRALAAVTAGRFVPLPELNVQTLSVDGVGTFDGRSTIDRWGESSIWNTSGNYIEISQLSELEIVTCIVEVSITTQAILTGGFIWKPRYRNSNNNVLGAPQCWIENYDGGMNEPGIIPMRLSFLHTAPSGADRITIDYVVPELISGFSVRNILIVGSNVRG